MTIDYPNIKRNAVQIGIIAGVEVLFGVIEGVVLPNLLEREMGAPYFMPSKEKIGSITTGLLITGLASGVISDAIISSFDVQDANRSKVIIATAIGVNILEVLYSANAPLSWKKKLKTPDLKTFAPAFAFLVVTSIMGGNLSDYLIGAIAPPLAAAKATTALPDNSQPPTQELAT